MMKTIITIILFALAFVLLNYVLPNYKVKKKNLPPREAKPSILIPIIQAFILIIYLYVEFREDIEAANTDKEVIFSNNQTIDAIDELQESSLTTEQKLIDEYVKRCRKARISIKELETLSSYQLKYIRNGIFADCGRFYESGYYDVFPWYEGIIMPEDFDWAAFNDCQVDNIEKIRFVEQQRELASE